MSIMWESKVPNGEACQNQFYSKTGQEPLGPKREEYANESNYR